jgi:hypothetical protein
MKPSLAFPISYFVFFNKIQENWLELNLLTTVVPGQILRASPQLFGLVLSEKLLKQVVEELCVAILGEQA